VLVDLGFGLEFLDLEVLLDCLLHVQLFLLDVFRLDQPLHSLLIYFLQILRFLFLAFILGWRIAEITKYIEALIK
jgi:hypothetical protein